MFLLCLIQAARIVPEHNQSIAALTLNGLRYLRTGIRLANNFLSFISCLCVFVLFLDILTGSSEGIVELTFICNHSNRTVYLQTQAQ